MSTGTVKLFNIKKGYGFIIPDDDNKEVFFHYSEIQMPGYKKLVKGQRVSFALTSTERGEAATQIEII